MNHSITIEEAIPHRQPMLLVDEILETTDGAIVARKTFRADEFFFQGHYPDHPIVPGVILCEAAVQAGALLVTTLTDDVKRPDGVPVLSRMNNVRFRRAVYPNDSIDLHVELLEVLSGAYFLRGTIKCENKTVASLDFTCTVTSKV